jgi:group I intron endonuclease
MTHYIYCATNNTNNKSYIGQTENFDERQKRHIGDAKRTTEKAQAGQRKFAFQNAIAKHKPEAFTWCIIEEHDNIDDANEAEEFFVAYLGTRSPNGYNIDPGGKNHKKSEESKEKIRAKLKIVGSFVGKSGANHPNYGTKLSEQRKKELSDMFSGDNSYGKKIDSITARQIYLDYLNDPDIYSTELATKYGLKKGAICNILNKKSWKKATEDLPDVNLIERTRGEKWVLSTITDEIARNILIDFVQNAMTEAAIARKYQVSAGLVHNIVVRRNWKHITI